MATVSLDGWRQSEHAQLRPGPARAYQAVELAPGVIASLGSGAAAAVGAWLPGVIDIGSERA